MNASIATLPDCSPNTANADPSEAAERLAICAASCHLRSVLPSSRQGIEAGHSGESTKRALTVGCYVTGM